MSGAPPAMGFDQARVKNTRVKMGETIKYQIRDYPAPLFNPNVIQKEPSQFERKKNTRAKMG